MGDSRSGTGSGGWPPGGRRHSPSPLSVLPFVLPALLIILVLAGLRGSAVAPGWAGRYHGDGVAVGVALEVVAGALLTVLLVRQRRAPQDDVVAVKLRTALRYLLVAAMVAIPAVLLLSVPLHPGRRNARSTPLTSLGKLPHGRLSARPPHPLHFPFADVLYGLLVTVLVAAVVWCGVLVARHWRGGPAAEPDTVFADEADDLRAAVRSGRRALRRLNDARAAIIACYAAMEQSLAEAGTVRAVADTPDELLARAVAAGLVRVGAAGRLTALFYEARFSTHPLGRRQRDEAEQALSEIAADLGDLRSSPAGAQAGGAAP